MSNKKPPFLIDRIKSVDCVLKGISILLCSERSIKTQVFLGILLMGLGFYFELTLIEWCLQILCIGGVLSLEAMNTAIEKTLDFIHPNHHKTVGRIKDIAAGSVGLFAFCVLVVLISIYGGKMVF